MSIPVACGCGKRFAAQPHLAGKQVQCPACQSPLSIPSPSPTASITVACQCGQRFAAKPELAGKRVQCPSCRSPLTIPGTPAAAQAPAQATAKPLVVVCQCGKKLQAPPHLLGKQVRCPMCQQPILVSNAPAAVPSYQQPAPASNDDDLWGDLPAAAAPAPASNDDDLWGDLPAAAAPAPSITHVPIAPAPRPTVATQTGLSNEYIAKAQAERAARDDDDDSWGNGKIISGVAMILGSLIWFCGGLAVGVIFFYPPILFVLGVVALINGIGQKMSR